MDEPGRQRFEVWIKDVKVAASDHECFVKVYVEGKEVFDLAAQIEYEDPASKQFGERPMPVGFSAEARATNLDGSQPKHLGKRKWQTKHDVEV